jgi:hypothetical protein
LLPEICENSLLVALPVCSLRLPILGRLSKEALYSVGEFIFFVFIWVEEAR